jgi:mono/diheme cytochrome c family protein
MRKRTFVIVGLLIAVLAVAVPVWAFRDSGDPQTSERKVPDNLVQAKQLFQTNCGACHTLYAAGTDGNFGPDLDEKLAPSGMATDETQIEGIKSLVLNAIEFGVPPVNVEQPETQPPTRMPAGILGGAQAEEVADFVARVAGQG